VRIELTRESGQESNLTGEEKKKQSDRGSPACSYETSTLQGPLLRRLPKGPGRRHALDTVHSFGWRDREIQHPTPYTPNLRPSTAQAEVREPASDPTPAPYILHPTPYILNLQTTPYTLNLQPSTAQARARQPLPHEKKI